MRCVIVDDENPAREELKYLLSSEPNIETVGEAEDGKTAIELVYRIKPDVVFLDIQMRGMSGFEVAQLFMKSDIKPYIVFVTAYDKYAIDAFELNAVDYLLKPISAGRLHKTIDRLQSMYHNKNHYDEVNLDHILKYMNKPKTVQKFCVYSNGKHIPLDPEDIIFASVDGRSTIIRSRKGDFYTSFNLVELEEKLKSNHFFRCHRSYLVNLNEINEIDNGINGTYDIVLNGYQKEKIPVSRNNAQIFRNLMDL